ncbi:RloB family protein [Corynebacterium diphtheriae]|uniref:RloB family protein n=1 Tax=Corynebacterium diphtheriae TaxID=1717 RepID=UPI000368A5BB|nr:RloB family protein [Corynebacterium diphtheriae]OJI02008.1 hypothetical protein BKD75_10360 [Corynebacterium diphtheriae]CAB0616564.1 RloB domain-containing protein [Corynebacterium diphtheriae]VEJ66493.1 Uncharacterised protein [Corynebacterium diphtheriae]
MSKSTKGKRKQRLPRKLLSRWAIVVEGSKDKSECSYFDRIKQIVGRNTSSLSVKVVPGDGEPTKVFEKAQSLRDNYDRIILVMDTDSHAHLSSVLQSCAKDSKIDAVVTSPMFELWLLWHVEDCARQLDKTTLEKLLKGKKIVDGKRGKSLHPAFPLDKYRDAITRAKRAWPNLTCNKPAPNPGSSVPWVLEQLDATQE